MRFPSFPLNVSWDWLANGLSVEANEPPEEKSTPPCFVNFAHRSNCPHSKNVGSVKRAEQPHRSFKPARFMAIEKQNEVCTTFGGSNGASVYLCQASVETEDCQHHLSDHNFSRNWLRSPEDVNAFPLSRKRNITLSLTKTCCACARLRVVWSHDKLSCCDLQSMHD